MQFPDRKRGFFRSGKETKRLRGGILQYVAQATLQVDTARAEKDRFRMETNIMTKMSLGEIMNGQNRKDIHPGLPVAIILKKDQRTGQTARKGPISTFNGNF